MWETEWKEVGTRRPMRAPAVIQVRGNQGLKTDSRDWEIGQNVGGEDMSRRKVFKSIPIFGAYTPEQ